MAEEKSYYKETNFFSSMKYILTLETITSFDLILATLVAVGAGILSSYYFDSELLNTILIAYLGIAIALIGVMVAGISIIAAIQDEAFLNFLARDNIKGFLPGFLFSFEWSILLSIITIMLSIIGLFIVVKISDTNTNNIASVAFGVVSFFFFYTLFTLQYLVGHIRRFVLLRQKFHVKRRERPADPEGKNN